MELSECSMMFTYGIKALLMQRTRSITFLAFSSVCRLCEEVEVLYDSPILVPVDVKKDSFLAHIETVQTR